MFDSQLCSIDW